MAAPRHHTPRSPDRHTLGPGVAAIARAKGRPLMPWQADAVDVALELDVEQHYAYGIVIVSVPRQAGKTKLEGDVADHRCLTTHRGRVWITMQNGKTVDEWMREEHFAALEDARAFGRPGTTNARYALSKRAGSVGVKWPRTGSTFTTFPPKRDALHSKQADLVFVDEAWAHGREQGADLRQAIRPTMATRRGAQLWVVSTMGDDSSEYLDDYIAMGRAALGNPDSRVCFIDYGIGDDVDPEDLDAIASAHPAYGHTITRSTLVDAREEFGPDVAGWARAYGNRATRTREAAIPAAVWAAAGRAQAPAPDRAGLGIDVTPGLDRAALAAGWRDHDHAFVELITTGPATREFPDLVAQVARRRRVPVIADRGSVGALEVMDAIARNHPDVEQRLTAMAEYAAACVQFERGIRDDQLHHFNDRDLDAAVEVATKRPLGDGAFGWGRKQAAGSIAELVAATLALRAFDTLPPLLGTRILTATRSVTTT